MSHEINRIRVEHWKNDILDGHMLQVVQELYLKKFQVEFMNHDEKHVYIKIVFSC